MTDVPDHWRADQLDSGGFLELVRRSFDFVIDAHGYGRPQVESGGIEHSVTYAGPRAALVLNWDVHERLFSTDIVRRMPDGSFDLDSRDWLDPNEILAVRGARDRWVTADDFADADAAGFERLLVQEASNLRDFCGDALEGNWSVQDQVRAWHDAESERLGSERRPPTT